MGTLKDPEFERAKKNIKRAYRLRMSSDVVESILNAEKWRWERDDRPTYDDLPDYEAEQQK